MENWIKGSRLRNTVMVIFNESNKFMGNVIKLLQPNELRMNTRYSCTKWRRENNYKRAQGRKISRKYLFS